MPPNTVYVGRGSKWGNPYRVGDTYAPWGPTRNPLDAIHAAALYEADLCTGMLDVSMLDVVGELRGKDLACWCPESSPCHADVLLEIANAEG